MSHPLHVVVVDDFGHAAGGATRVALTSAAALQELGVPVSYFSVDGQADLPGVVAHTSGQAPLASGGLDRVRDAGRGLWNRTAAERLDALLASLPATGVVAHLHGWTRALSPAVLAVLRRRDVAVVATAHDYAMACPNGRFFDFSTQQRCTRTPLGTDCLTTPCDPDGTAGKIARGARALLQRHAAGFPGSADAVVVVSRTAERTLRPHLPADLPVVLVPNPTEVAHRPATDPGAHPEVVMVGRMEAEKGVELAAAAARQAGVPLRLVGDGSRTGVVRERWPEVAVTGWLDGPAVVEELRAARALVLPSLWQEGQPLVVAEAAAHGVPAVVADGTAAVEVVEHDVTGLHARHGDVASFAAALRRLQDPALARRLGAEAYTRFWDAPMTPRRHATALLEVYDQVLARRGVASVPATTGGRP